MTTRADWGQQKCDDCWHDEIHERAQPVETDGEIESPRPTKDEHIAGILIFSHYDGDSIN